MVAKHQGLLLVVIQQLGEAHLMGVKVTREPLRGGHLEGWTLLSCALRDEVICLESVYHPYHHLLGIEHLGHHHMEHVVLGLEHLSDIGLLVIDQGRRQWETSVLL